MTALNVFPCHSMEPRPLEKYRLFELADLTQQTGAVDSKFLIADFLECLFEETFPNPIRLYQKSSERSQSQIKYFAVF